MNFLTPEITITPVNPTPSDYEDNDGQEEYDENPPNYASMLEQQYDENPPNYASMLEQVMFEQGVMPDPTKEVSFINIGCFPSKFLSSIVTTPPPSLMPSYERGGIYVFLYLTPAAPKLCWAT